VTPPIVEARDLTVAFGERVAVEAATFAVPPGSSVAVLGPNGAGKSTIFAAAVGLVPVRSGAIEVRSDRIALVPQRLDLAPGFPVTALDVVRMGRYGELGPLRRFRARDHDLVERAMEALDIQHLAGRRFTELSGGERQRALLAQAAAQDPEVLLLDEPFTGVDAPTGEAVRALLGRWREEGRATFVATHDLASAARDYDLVLCLNRRVVAFGPPAETLTEDVLAETFAGRILRVGDLVVDVAHHHHGAG
jgi:ABC-type Mn2+/Zn2+ transport system ATPase subunit